MFISLGVFLYLLVGFGGAVQFTRNECGSADGAEQLAIMLFWPFILFYKLISSSVNRVADLLDSRVEN